MREHTVAMSEGEMPLRRYLRLAFPALPDPYALEIT